MQVPTSKDQWASPILALSAHRHPWRFSRDPPLTKRSDGLVRLMMMDNRRRVGPIDAENTTTKGVWTLTTRTISDSRDRRKTAFLAFFSVPVAATGRQVDLVHRRCTLLHPRALA